MVDEGAGLGAVRDVGAVEGFLEERQRSTGWNQYCDVAGAGWAPGRRSCRRRPASCSLQGLVDDGGDVGGFAFAEDGGLGAGEVVVGVGAEDGDGWAGAGRSVLVVAGIVGG